MSVRDDFPTRVSGDTLPAAPHSTDSDHRSASHHRPALHCVSCLPKEFANFIFVSSEQDNEDEPTGSSADDLPAASSPVADHLIRAPPPPCSAPHYVYPPFFLDWRGAGIPS